MVNRFELEHGRWVHLHVVDDDLGEVQLHGISMVLLKCGVGLVVFHVI